MALASRFLVQTQPFAMTTQICGSIPRSLGAACSLPDTSCAAAQKLLLQVMGHKRLLESHDDVMLLQKIQLRAPYVTPLNVLQVPFCMPQPTIHPCCTTRESVKLQGLRSLVKGSSFCNVRRVRRCPSRDLSVAAVPYGYFAKIQRPTRVSNGRVGFFFCRVRATLQLTTCVAGLPIFRLLQRP